MNLNENIIEWYDEVFDFLKDEHPDWGKITSRWTN